MILLNTYRSYARAAKDYFFPYINLYKKSKVQNVARFSRVSEEFLTAIMLNCVLSEIELLFDKKLLNTSGSKIKFQFSDAQGILFYKTLMALPVPSDQYYLQKIANEWIQLLDQQIIRLGIYESQHITDDFTDDYGTYGD